MADLSLTRLDRDGFELFVDQNTGRAYASIRATARMCSKGESTIRAFVGAQNFELLEAEVQTPKGLQSAQLLSSEQVFKAALKYCSELAEKMGAAGANVFLCGMAGYQVTVAPVTQQARQLPPVRDIVDYVQAKSFIDNCPDPLFRSIANQRLLEELGANNSLPSAEQSPQVLVAVRAKALGYTNKQIGDGSRLGAFVKKVLKPVGKTQHGRYGVNVYDLTPELDETIHAFFR